MRLGGVEFAKAGSTVNTNLAFGSQHAVGAMPAAANGFHDVMGSVWQWCEDFFAALPGFKVHSFYDDFSTPCFDGQHNVIMGGSWASSGDLSSVFARFHFRPHFFQHAGFRLVKSSHQPILTSMDAPPPHAAGWVPPSSDPSRDMRDAVVDSNTLISLKLQQHYSTSANTFVGPGQCLADPLGAMVCYPRHIAAVLASKAKALGLPFKRALDLGCSVGGTCFELARSCDEVIGVDQSLDMIKAANGLRASGHMDLFCQDEGALTSTMKAVVDVSVDRTRVSFKQMDAMCLSPVLGEFDLVVVSKLVELLISPMSCLGRLAGRQGVVKMGGLVLVGSTFDWDPKKTPEDLWLGGRYDDISGAEVRSRDGLAKAMDKNFKLVHEEDVPQV
jgi:SAM-dependent methyltransferase